MIGQLQTDLPEGYLGQFGVATVGVHVHTDQRLIEGELQPEEKVAAALNHDGLDGDALHCSAVTRWVEEVLG